MSTIHNPVNFNPADYEIVGCFDNHPPEFFVNDFTRGPTQEEYAEHKAALLAHEATA